MAVALAVPCAAGIAEWTPHGPDGGVVNALAFAPSNTLVVYAGTYRNGVFRSTDAGRSWSPANVGLPPVTVLSLAINPHDAGVVFAGTDDGRVFVTSDGGQSWRNASGSRGADGSGTLLEGTLVNGLVLDPFDPTTIYAGTSAGVFWSRDFGASWAAPVAGSGPQPSGVVALAADAHQRGTLWAAAGNGLFRSGDGGATWLPMAFGGVPFPCSGAVVVDPRDSQIVFATSLRFWGGPTAFPIYEVFGSGDGGATWTEVTSTSIAGPFFTIIVDPADSSHIVAASVPGLLDSRDGGATWQVKFLPQSLHLSTLVFEPDQPGRLVVGTSGFGVATSTDGGATWTPSNRGLWSAGIGALVVAQADTPVVFAATGERGIAAFDASTGQWRPAGDGLLSPAPFLCCVGITALAADPWSPTTLYAGGSYTGVFKSWDGGRHWFPARMGLERGSPTSGDYVSGLSLAIDPHDTQTLYAGTDGGVFKSTDGAVSWRLATTGMARYSWVSAVAVDPVYPSTVYCGEVKGVYRSSDRATSWEPVLTPAEGTSVRALVVDPNRAGRVYAGFWGAGLYRSDDHGATWQKLTFAVELSCTPGPGGSLSGCPRLNVLAVDLNHPGSLWVGTSLGVWRTLDDGATWASVGTAAAGLEVSSIAFEPSTGTVYAGTWSAGLVSLEQPRPRRHLRAKPPPLGLPGSAFLPR